MPGAPGHGIEQRLDLRAKPPILWWAQQIDARHECAHLCLRLLQGNVRTQSANGVARAVFTVGSLLRRHCPRNPEVRHFSGGHYVGCARKRKPSGHDSNDAIRLRVEEQCLAQYLPLRAKPFSPQTMTNYCDPLSSLLIVLLIHRPS